MCGGFFTPKLVRYAVVLNVGKPTYSFPSPVDEFAFLFSFFLLLLLLLCRGRCQTCQIAQRKSSFTLVHYYFVLI